MTELSGTYLFGLEKIAPDAFEVAPLDAEHGAWQPNVAYQVGDEVWDRGRILRKLTSGGLAPTTDAGAWLDLGVVDEGALAWAPGSYASGDFAVFAGRLIRSTSNGNSADPAGGIGVGQPWADYGPTRRTAAFDPGADRRSDGIGEMTWTFTVPRSINAMVILKPRGRDLRVTVDGPLGNQIDDRTYTLVEGVTTPYEYHFAPIEPKSRLAIHGLPPGSGNKITITISGGDAQTVGAGLIGIGFAQDVGVTTIGSGVTLTQFDPPSQTEWGVDFSNRPSQWIANFRLAHPSRRTDAILTRAARAQSGAVAAYATKTEGTGMCLVGYFAQIPVDHSAWRVSEADLEIFGLPERDYD